MGRLSYTEAQIDEGIGRALTELAEKPATSTAGDLASLKADGNLDDSGIAASSVALKSEVQNITPKRTSSNDPSNSSFSVLCDTAIAGQAKPKLYGKSVVINQLVGILLTDASVTANNVTITDNRDGSYTIQTTAEGASANTSVNVCNNVTNSVKTQNGHTYFKRGANTAKGVQIQDSYAGWNLTSTDEAIFTRTAAGTGFSNIALYVPQGTIITTPVKVYPQTIDLSRIFSASELTAIGTSVANLKAAWLKKYGYPLPQYIPYNAGSIVSNNATYQLHGRNLWDEEWEVGGISAADGQNTVNASGKRSVNYVPIAPSGSYYFHCPNAVSANRVAFYDANKAYSADTVLRWQSFSNGGVIVAPADAKYMRFYFTDYDPTGKVCVNISDASFNGQYEAYYNGGTVTADSLNGVGTAMDEQDAEGQIVRRIGSVDLGAQPWTREQVSGASFYRFQTQLNDRATASYTNVVCAQYVTETSAAGVDQQDKTIKGLGTTTYIVVRDDSYTDAATFRAAMSGVYLAYELATPTTSTTSAANLSTQAGYNCLDPVSGDVQSADAEMEYAVDIVAYVDSKVADLTALMSSI
ncbi:MAG: hypothetical protein IKF39_01675 [Oscillospiraceae bacterium]|nr:hypothetical protein [Oscillospiraceae bacterium]